MINQYLCYGNVSVQSSGDGEEGTSTVLSITCRTEIGYDNGKCYFERSATDKRFEQSFENMKKLREQQKQENP